MENLDKLVVAHIRFSALAEVHSAYQKAVNDMMVETERATNLSDCNHRCSDIRFKVAQEAARILTECETKIREMEEQHSSPSAENLSALLNGNN